MKITFLVPPVFDNKKPAERSAGCTRVVYPAPNLYELYAASILQRDSQNEIYHEDFVNSKKGVSDFVDFIKTDNSDVYIIWTVNLSIDTDKKAIDIILKSKKDVTIILLGPGATYFTKKILKDNKIIVVRGEPEITLEELVKSLNSGSDIKNIKGISYLDNNGEIVNASSREPLKELDSLPFPDRKLLKNFKFHNPKLKKTPYTTLITSRNCPYQCIYCVPSSLTFAREIEFRKNHSRKPPISFRSPENIEAEVSLLAKEGYKAIGIMDDNFIWNEERTKAIAEILKKYDMVWGCQARVDAITEPIAKILSENNCMYVDLGIESFNDKILEYIKKGIKSDDIYKAIGLLKKYNVPVKLNILIGSSPLENKETVKHTLREAKKLKVDQVMFNIVSPFPGTEFYKICKENGWIKTGEYIPTDVQRESILNLPDLTSKEMERLLFRNNINYFLSFDFISKQIKRFNSIEEFRAALKALKIKLFG